MLTNKKLLFTTAFLAALVGSITTVILYPAIKSLESKVWERENAAATRRFVIEKRVETVQRFHTASTSFKACIEEATPLATTRKPGESPIYISKYCSKELDELWNSTTQANIYFDEENSEVNEEIAKLRKAVGQYIFKAALSPFRTESYIEKVSQSLDGTENAMLDSTFIY